MDTKAKFIYILLAIILLLSMCSCDHKALCYHHPHITTLRVEFDWQDAPDAQPQMMRVIFFPEEGEEPGNYRTFLFQGRTGGPVEVPEGRYRMVCYNADTETTQLRGEHDFFQIEAFTRTGGLFEHIWGSFVDGPVIDMEQPVVLCPDMMWGCAATDVDVSAQQVSYLCVPEKDKDQWLGKPATRNDAVIVLYPHELVCHYSYEIRHVKNLEAVKRLSGALSAMSGQLFLGEERLGAQPDIVPFAARKGDDGESIVGEFLTFGRNTAFEKRACLTIYAWMRDDSQLCFGRDGSMDATPQILAAPDRRHVHLIFDGLTFPEAFETTGMDAQFDDWSEEHHDIIM